MLIILCIIFIFPILSLSTAAEGETGSDGENLTRGYGHETGTLTVTDDGTYEYEGQDARPERKSLGNAFAPIAALIYIAVGALAAAAVGLIVTFVKRKETKDEERDPTDWNL